MMMMMMVWWGRGVVVKAVDGPCLSPAYNKPHLDHHHDNDDDNESIILSLFWLISLKPSRISNVSFASHILAS